MNDEALDLFARAGRPAARPLAKPRTAIPEHPIFGRAKGPGAKYFVQVALWPHVEQLAKDRVTATPPGFTSDDVRAIAIDHGFATGEEEEIRTLSWIGPWLRGIARRGSIAHILDSHGAPIKRPSERPESHGNPQYVYTATRTGT